KTPKGLLAERTGELEIFPPGFQRGKDKLGAREQVLRKLLEKKFGRVLKPKFEMDEITFDEPLDKMGVLVTTQVESDKGWLVLAWKRVPAFRPAPPRQRDKREAQDSVSMSR